MDPVLWIVLAAIVVLAIVFFLVYRRRGSGAGAPQTARDARWSGESDSSRFPPG